MKQVRIEIGHQLIDALHECNCADVTDTTGYSGNYVANDINAKCSNQHEAYGHIGNALTSLGFNRAREVYASGGDIDAAHDAVSKKQRTRAARLADERFEHIDMVGGAA